MSKRSHHRSANPININELADALTRNGWQPPNQSHHNANNFNNNNAMQGMNQSFGNNGASPQLSNNLSALTSLLGAVSGGGMQGMGQPGPGGAMPPMSSNGITPQMPGNGVPPMPMGGMPPMPTGGMPPIPAGGMPPMPAGGMPQMPMGPMMPSSPLQAQQAANHRAAPAQPAAPTTDIELLKKLFQEILKLLKET